MKRRIAAIAVAIICLISVFSISCFAAETQAPATQAPTAHATVVPEGTNAETQLPTESSTVALSETPTYNSPLRGEVTEAPTVIETVAAEATEASEATGEEPEAPDTGKAFVIGLACVLLGGIIAGVIIYHKRKNDDGSDEE